MIGSTIGHYKIGEKLGEGGMGVVYKAQDTKLNRPVALKFLPPHVSANESIRARFLQEAQAAAVLNHPHICTIYTIEEAEDRPFIVMEYVEGVTLRRKIQSSLPSSKAAIDYAIQIGEGLYEAHSKGIVHRDIKPENIMVNEKNEVKIMDFGLAKLKGSIKLTKTSSTVGTLAYMAPEQIQGEEVDPKTDIFALGVLLYEMLTGKLPFRGEHEAAMLYSITHEEPEPLQKYLPAASSELLHIMNRALEKDPGDRYLHVQDMIVDMRRLGRATSRVSTAYQAASGIPPLLEKQTPRSKKLLWISLAAGATVAVAFIVLYFGRSRELRLNDKREFQSVPMSITKAEYAALSSSGNYIAFSTRNDLPYDGIYWKHISESTARLLTSGMGLTVLFGIDISPDDKEIVFSTRVGRAYVLHVVSTVTGRPLVIPESFGIQPAWHPDGQIIGYLGMVDVNYSQKGMEFWTVRSDGSQNRLVFSDSTSANYPDYAYWAWSPSGDSVVWNRQLENGYHQLIVRDLSTQKEFVLTNVKERILGISWADNDVITFASDRGGSTNIWAMLVSGGDAVQVTSSSGPDLYPKLSRNGLQLLYLQSSSIGYIWTANTDGTMRKRLTTENRMSVSPALSWDGTKVAFTQSIALGAEDYQLHSMNSDGTDIRRLSVDSGWAYGPSWSPDGEWIAYTVLPRGSNEMRTYLIDSDNPAVKKFVSEGWVTQWISRTDFLVWKDMATWRCSTTGTPPVRMAPDSVSVEFLTDDNRVLYYDWRIGRKGYWLAESADSIGTSSHPELISTWTTDSDVSSTGQYRWHKVRPDTIYVAKSTERAYRRLPFSIPFSGFSQSFDISHDGRRVVYQETDFRTEISLIKNPFIIE